MHRQPGTTAFTAATRSGVSLPCSCSMSRLERIDPMASCSASSASTVSATLSARPASHGRRDRARSQKPRLRGDGGQSTNPTISRARPSATSSVSRAWTRPRITARSDMQLQPAPSRACTGRQEPNTAGSGLSSRECCAQVGGEGRQVSRGGAAGAWRRCRSSASLRRALPRRQCR